MKPDLPYADRNEDAGLDDIVVEVLKGKLTMDKNGVYSPIENPLPDIEEYVKTMWTRPPTFRLCKQDVRFVSETWPAVHSYLRSNTATQIIQDRRLPLLRSPTLRELHLCIMFGQRVEIGLFKQFQCRLKNYTMIIRLLFYNGPEAVDSQMKRLKDVWKGVDVPDEFVLLWLVHEQFQETQRGITLAQVDSTMAEAYRAALDAKCPVVLVACYESDLHVNKYRLYIEGELYLDCNEVCEAIFMYLCSWYLFDMSTTDLPVKEPADGNLEGGKRAKGRRKLLADKKTYEKTAKCEIKWSLRFLAVTLLNVESEHPTKATHADRHTYLRMERRFKEALQKMQMKNEKLPPLDPPSATAIEDAEDLDDPQ